MQRYLLLIIIVSFLAGAFYVFQNSHISNPTPPASHPVPSSPPQESLMLEGIFEGTTPCDGTKPPLPQIPIGSACEMTQWHITFNPDFTYTLSATYGMVQQNSTGIKNGGKQIMMQGNWSEDPNTKTIQLARSNSARNVSFVKISNELIHLLDNDNQMRIGHGGWSYTLSKTSR